MNEQKETSVEDAIGGHHRSSMWMAVGIVSLLLRIQCDVGEVYHKTKAIEERLNNPRPELITENVIGDKAPEKFYEISGKRIYLEVDGVPVEKHFEGGI